MKSVAIIPARGGSKGIPHKNIHFLHGKPMIAWIIEAALGAKLVDRVVVSTDDAEIARAAAHFGAEVIDRPASISGDLASSEAALLHSLEVLECQRDYCPELLIFLQCTSPLTTSADIDHTVQCLLDDDADSALAVVPFHYFLWRKGDDGSGSGINHDKGVRLMRQQREPEFLEAGSVYVMKVPGFLEHKHRFFGKTALHVMPAERRWEVDDPIDLKVADVLMAERCRNDRSEHLPVEIGLVVFDFDGVFTDNRVLVAEDGTESVFCNRSDGLAISWLRQSEIRALILSKERNGVVAARGRKVGLPVAQGVDNKAAYLKNYCLEHSLSLSSVVYVGNDLNDLDCMRIVGCPVAVADAYPEVMEIAKIRLRRSGGQGAIRELIELILARHSP